MTHKSDARSSSVVVPVERRSGRRLRPAQPVSASSDLGHRFYVMDVSSGGALLHGPHELAVGDLLDLRFGSSDSDSTITLSVRVVHGLRVTSADGRSYITGVEFVHDAPEAIERLVSACTSAPSEPPRQ